MPRYFLKLSYRGLPYHGWQIQPNAISVQQCIEESLGKALRAPTPIVGAGRTDAGVNARLMYAHFDTAEPIADSSRLIAALNSMLGPDIAIYSIIPVHSDAHARFDATERTYHYYATTVKSPFFHQLSWQASPTLNFDAMNRAAALLLDTTDFTSFAKLHTDAKTNICHVSHAQWHPIPTIPGGHVFVITADRFLRNMVRAVVGTLVDVGRGKISTDQFAQIIAQRDRCAAGTSMPPQALYLWDVKYPYIPSDTSTEIFL